MLPGSMPLGGMPMGNNMISGGGMMGAMPSGSVPMNNVGGMPQAGMVPDGGLGAAGGGRINSTSGSKSGGPGTPEYQRLANNNAGNNMSGMMMPMAGGGVMQPQSIAGLGHMPGNELGNLVGGGSMHPNMPMMQGSVGNGAMAGVDMGELDSASRQQHQSPRMGRGGGQGPGGMGGLDLSGPALLQ
eukprot:gene16506-22734_t